MREITSLDELTDLVCSRPRLFVRWSKGPDSDGSETSRDRASGLELPGLAVNPREPPSSRLGVEG